MLAGMSIAMLPWVLIMNWCRSAAFTSLSPGIRMMWPIHLSLRSRMSHTRLYVLVRLLASTCAVFPVNLLKHLALAPLILARVHSSRFHASLPYVRRDVTAVLYTLILMPKLIFELKTCRSWPMWDMAIPTRLRTSYW